MQRRQYNTAEDIKIPSPEEARKCQALMREINAPKGVTLNTLAREDLRSGKYKKYGRDGGQGAKDQFDIGCVENLKLIEKGEIIPEDFVNKLKNESQKELDKKAQEETKAKEEATARKEMTNSLINSLLSRDIKFSDKCQEGMDSLDKTYGPGSSSHFKENLRFTPGNSDEVSAQCVELLPGVECNIKLNKFIEANRKAFDDAAIQESVMSLPISKIGMFKAYYLDACNKGVDVPTGKQGNKR